MARVRVTQRLATIGDLVAQGLTNQEIADRMSLREQTVKNYMHDLFRILGVRNRVQFVTVFRRKRRSLQQHR